MEPTLGESVKSLMKNAATLIGVLLGLPFLGWGVFIVASQLMFWFKTGEWVAVSMFDLFLAPDGISSILPPSSPYNALPDMLWGSWVWIVRPTDWYGLHKIASGLLRFIPLSLASLV